MAAISRRLAVILALTLIPLVGLARADEVQDVMKAWLADTANQGTIPPGTKITMQNWQQFKQFMPVGMIALFEGKYYWKMPSDVEIDVGPTVNHPLPKAFVEATEKYSSQTRVIHRPDGRNDIANYVAGWPFPNNPDIKDPDAGYKILANIWFPPIPYKLAVTPDNDGDGSTCTVDHFGNYACSRIQGIYRQLDYNWDPRTPRTHPKAGGAWYTQFLMQDKPEQSKYTAVLTIFWREIPKDEDDYIFVPSLRRSLRLSATARCSPIFGTDFVKDDARTGFDGGLAIFGGDYLGTRKLLSLPEITNAPGNYPAEYDQPLGWAKPSWGLWQVRPSYVLDVRRLPPWRAGYCYGSRMMYVDAQFGYQMWLDLYDSNLKLWKIECIGRKPDVMVPGEGVTPLAGGLSGQMWDVQNDHATQGHTASPDGKRDGLRINDDVPAAWDDVSKYSTPGGLMTIMR
jgi:hypothetical protein